MRYFDGISPKACCSCFTWNGQNWIQTEPGLCDECDYMLDMFPLIDGNKERERKAPPNCRGRQDAPGVDADGWRRIWRKQKEKKKGVGRIICVSIIRQKTIIA